MVISVDKPLFKPLLPKSRADFNASSKKPLFFSYQKAVSALLPKSRANQKAVQVGTLLRSGVFRADRF